MAVSQNEQSYAEEIMNLVNQKQIRCDFDDRDDTIGKKIRSAEVEWIPYTIVVGPKEKEKNTISVRKRLIGQPLENGTNEQLNDISLEELIIMINNDLDGLPRRPLPLPFRKFSTRILFRQ